VKLLLFKPFDIGKWFIIGFCAWLAYLGEQGARANFNFGGNYGNRDRDVSQDVERARDYVVENLHWIIPVAVVLVLLVFALWVVFTWLNSRGKFMFLHCVALNKAEVVVPWDKFSREGNSLFWFRFALGLIGTVMTLPLVALIAVSIYGMVRHGRPSVVAIAIAAAGVLLLIAIAIVFALINKFAVDFVVPIMFLRRRKCLEAWGEFRHLLTANGSNFALYILFSIVLAVIIETMVLFIVLLTCCIACCFLAIPYVGTVLLLPVFAFKRSYSLHYLAQFGSEYDVFQAAVSPTTAAPAV
jgi:hypothetical protein